jgi:hypothetical protein
VGRGKTLDDHNSREQSEQNDNSLVSHGVEQQTQKFSHFQKTNNPVATRLEQYRYSAV